MDERMYNFLLKEYENISKAHFDANSAIMSFYRFYLLIMSIPVSAGAFGLLSVEYIMIDKVIITVLSIVLYLVGILVMDYVVHLEQEKVLYARTVNGVRNEMIRCSICDEISDNIVLPIDPNVPKFQMSTSKFILFYIINTLYPFLATYVMLRNMTLDAKLVLVVLVLFLIISFIIHIIIKLIRDNKWNKKYNNWRARNMCIINNYKSEFDNLQNCQKNKEHHS